GQVGGVEDVLPLDGEVERQSDIVPLALDEGELEGLVIEGGSRKAFRLIEIRRPRPDRMAAVEGDFRGIGAVMGDEGRRARSASLEFHQTELLAVPNRIG